MAEVELIGISKSFDKVKALTGVSLKADDRRVLTLLGPSGCGKTTLLRLVAGLETPDDGDIRIGGEVVTHLPPPDRDVAMVFQNYALYPHMNVYDNISIGLRLRKVPRAEVRTRVLANSEMLGIQDLLGRKPKALSGGQRQRVALARAIVRQPKVFLLDEPLSNLDAALRERTRTELKLLFSRISATVIYVTHDQVEAMTLSDTVAVLRDGYIEQIGSPHEIYRNPVNTFVATFVGSPQMNLLEGVYRDGKVACDSLPLAFQPECAVGIQEGTKFLIGIRPEDISLAPASEDGGLRCKVLVSEPLGGQTILTLLAGAAELKALAASSSCNAGTPAQEYAIALDVRKLHLFEKASGKRLAVRAAHTS